MKLATLDVVLRGVVHRRPPVARRLKVFWQRRWSPAQDLVERGAELARARDDGVHVRAGHHLRGPSRVSTSAGSEIATKRVVPSNPTGTTPRTSTEVLGSSATALGSGGDAQAEVAVGEVEMPAKARLRSSSSMTPRATSSPPNGSPVDALLCQRRLDVAGGDEAVGHEPVTEPGSA